MIEILWFAAVIAGTWYGINKGHGALGFVLCLALAWVGFLILLFIPPASKSPARPWEYAHRAGQDDVQGLGEGE